MKLVFVSTSMEHNNTKMNIKICGFYLKLVLLVYLQKNFIARNIQSKHLTKYRDGKKDEEYTNSKVIGGRIHRDGSSLSLVISPSINAFCSLLRGCFGLVIGLYKWRLGF